MYAGKLDVLRDGILDNLAVAGYGVELNLLGILEELGDDHGELLGHLGGLSKEAMHLLVVVAYVHRGA